MSGNLLRKRHCTLQPPSRDRVRGSAGNQGHADVATTSLPPLDEGHLKPAVAEAAPKPRQGGGAFSRAFDAVARSAADAAKGAASSTFIFRCSAREESYIVGR